MEKEHPWLRATLLHIPRIIPESKAMYRGIMIADGTLL